MLHLEATRLQCRYVSLILLLDATIMRASQKSHEEESRECDEVA